LHIEVSILRQKLQSAQPLDTKEILAEKNVLENEKNILLSDKNILENEKFVLENEKVYIHMNM
jgi:hypothetical protein